MKDVSEAVQYLDKESIACKLYSYLKNLRWFVNSMTIVDAAKKYEYIVRQQKSLSEEQKELNARNSRVLQRRQRVSSFT